MVGIVGTKLVTHSSTYQTHLGLRGIQVLAPSAEQADFVDRVIFEELIYGYSRPESHAGVIDVVQGLAQQGCEAVIIASSELPLILQEDTCPLPVYDSAEILAEAAVLRTMKPV